MEYKNLSLFERMLLEAEGDPPPDVPSEEAISDSPPPDMGQDDGPPDLPPDAPDSSMGDEPPDLDGTDPDGDMMDQGNMDEEQQPEENPAENMELDEKISAAMNLNLYQRFLSLLNNIGNQIAAIKNNTDVLYTLSPEALTITENLKKTDENINMYLKDYFKKSNYSKNLLFFNKCLNMLKLLNDTFDKNIKKGIRASE